MAGPISQAGGTVEPSEYAALSMDTQFTGIWTQRNPLRDADVPYIQRKYYSASRFDSIIDGINREISGQAHRRRRSGLVLYYSACLSAREFDVLLQVEPTECHPAPSDDGRPDGTRLRRHGRAQNQHLHKIRGAQKTRFLGVANTLYMSNQVDQMKMLRSTTPDRTTDTAVKPGSLMINGNPGIVQMALGGITMTIVAHSLHRDAGLHLDRSAEHSRPIREPSGSECHLRRFDGRHFSKRKHFRYHAVLDHARGFSRSTSVHATYNQTTDTGTATTGNGITSAGVLFFSSIP